MLTLLKIAITGNLACGKSSVCGFLKNLGAYVVSADEIVHQLFVSDRSLRQKIVAFLGEEVVVNETVDRTVIAQKVFRDPILLKELETLLHPAVWDEIERQSQQVKVRVFVVEIPLLFETGREHDFDLSVVVVADSKQCQQRFEVATKLGQEEYQQRLLRQEPIEDKQKKADYVIENNHDLDTLKQKTEELYHYLLTIS